MEQKNAIATKDQMSPALQNEMKAMMPTLAPILPRDLPMEKFRASTWLELQTTPALLSECTPASVMECVVKAATYGLMPSRDCHFVPFRDKRKGGKKVATFIPNYQGVQRSLDSTGKVAKSFAHPVYSRDHYEIDYLADVFSHRPARGDRGELVCFYGCVILKDGTKHVQEMSLAEIDAIRRRAPAHETGPWATDFIPMARKTALKQTAKYCNLSDEVTALLVDDEARERDDIPHARVQQHVDDLFGEGDQAAAFEAAARGGNGAINAEDEVTLTRKEELDAAVISAYTEIGANAKHFQIWLQSQGFGVFDDPTELQLERILAHIEKYGTTALTRDFDAEEA